MGSGVDARERSVLVIGAGPISEYHLRALHALPEVRRLGVFSRSPHRAEAAARDIAVPHSGLLADAMAASEADAVVVATPDATHAAIAADLLARGVDVLVQKPLATTSADARDLAAFAATAPGRLSASFMHRYLDEIVRLRELLADDQLGMLRSVRLRNATPGPDWNADYFADAQPLGGVVGQLGVHGIDLARFLFGELELLFADVRARDDERRLADGRTVPLKVPDVATAVYQLESGATVVHEMDWGEPAGTDRFSLEVVGSRGVARVRCPSGIQVIEPAGSTEISVEREPTFGARHHRHWLRGELYGTVEDAVRGIEIAERIMRLGTRLGADSWERT